MVAGTAHNLKRPASGNQLEDHPLPENHEAQDDADRDHDDAQYGGWPTPPQTAPVFLRESFPGAARMRFSEDEDVRADLKGIPVSD